MGTSTTIKLKADFTSYKKASTSVISQIDIMTGKFVQLAKPMQSAQQAMAKAAFGAKNLSSRFFILKKTLVPITTNLKNLQTKTLGASKVLKQFQSRVTTTNNAMSVYSGTTINATAATNMYTAAVARASAAQAGMALGAIGASAVGPMVNMPPMPTGLQKGILGLGAVGRSAAKGINALRNAFVGLTLATGSFIKTLGPLLAILGIMSMVKFSKEATELNNRIRVIAPTTEKATKWLEKLAKVAKDTRTSVKETTVVFVRFRLATERMNYSAEEVLTTVTNLNKMMKVQGVSAHETKSAMLQLSQGLQSGRLAGDEFRAVQEILPALLGDIADATGYPIEQLKQLASEGKITPQVVMDALLKNTAKIDAMFERTRMTMEDFGTQVSNVFITMLARISMLDGGGQALSITFESLLEIVEVLGLAVSILVKLFFISVFAMKKLDQQAHDAAESFSFLGLAMGALLPKVPGPKDASSFSQFTGSLKEVFTEFDTWLTTQLNEGKLKEAPLGETTAELAARKAREDRNNEALQHFQNLKTGMNFQDMIMSLNILDEKIGEVFYQGLFQDIPQGMGTAVADTLMEGKSLKDGLSKMFKDMAKKIIASLIMMVVQMLIVKAIMASLGLTTMELTGGAGSTGGISGFIGKLFGGKKAHGGPVSGGRSYIVGEEGPELFTPSGGGNITPNNQMGGIVIQNLSIMPNSSIDQALMDKPPSYWLEMAQEKILPALNSLGQGGETTSLEFRGVR